MNNAPTWKVIVAFLLDLVGSFFVFGYLIGLATGGTTSRGFQLEGAPALLLIVAVIAYFVIMNKFLGGTLGKRLLGIVAKK